MTKLFFWAYFRLPRLWMGRTGYAAWVQSLHQRARAQRRQQFDY